MTRDAGSRARPRTARAATRRRRVRLGDRRRPAAAPRAEHGRHRARPRPPAPPDHPGATRPRRCSAYCWRRIAPSPRTSRTTPAYGEPYNSRERHFVATIGDDAGWLHAGRPRREAARVALRILLRGLTARLAAGRLPSSPPPPVVRRLATARSSCRTRPISSRRSPRRSATTCSGSCRRRSGTASVCWTRWPSQHQPRRRGVCQRQPVARRPPGDRGPARVRRRHRRTPATRCGRPTPSSTSSPERQPAVEPVEARRGPRDLVQPGVRLRRSRRPLHAASVLMPQKRNPYALSIVRGGGRR